MFYTASVVRPQLRLCAITENETRNYDEEIALLVLMPRSRRGFHSVNSTQERVRTHLFFSSQSEHHTAKRKRRTHNKLHQILHRKDEMVQAGPAELEPSLWSGNQRVLHFGPMAQRDPFFYYYPKGWDILYPAHFGFFPYRATKFRGSSSAVCVCAFGVFLLLGGALMLCLGYFVLENSPSVWTLDTGFGFRLAASPIRLAAPLFGETVRKQHEPPRVTILTRYFKEPSGIYEKSPYMPLPPPAYPVLENRYAQSAMYNPQSELKLYPPVVPGRSTLSLHGREPSAYLANPYNTLRAVSVNSVPGRSTLSLHGREPSAYLANPYNTLRAVSVNRHCSTLDSNGSSAATRERIRSGSVAATRRRSSESSHAHRSKSLAPPQKNERIRRAAI
ncbi:hypothetical protein Tcan_06566 [Toxocara canis]|uniref:Uncharacterized protein n=1 Tax=Toxocara canis TaxID=6265 RepID=A0A0B2W033_TOXCA|nr:hypothetical protein Tcan_06566 [Toxocara canis]